MEIGDRITFRAMTVWNGAKKATRIINGFESDGRPTVRYGGHSDFVVRKDEVIEVHRKESSND